MTQQVVTNGELLAYLDKELTAAEVSRIDAALRVDATLRRRLDSLADVRDGLEEMYAAEAPAPDADAGFSGEGRTPPSRIRSWGWVAAVLAACVVVGWVWSLDRDRERTPAPLDRPAENEWLRIRAVPTRGGVWPLFSAASIELEWAAKSSRRIVLLPRPLDKELEVWSREVADQLEDDECVPVFLQGRVEGPSGLDYAVAWSGGSAFEVAGAPARVGQPGTQPGSHPESQPGSQAGSQPGAQRGPRPTTQVVPLWELVGDPGGVGPYFSLSPQRDGWKEDFRWAFGTVGNCLTGSRGLVPEAVGEYRIRMELCSVPSPEGRGWGVFDEPLRLDVTLRTEAQIGDWSEPVDGLRVRLVTATAHAREGETTAFALQILNESDRPRSYNHMGMTRAQIPQPFHFGLLVDGQECTQRDDLDVIIAASSLGIPHPVGAVRSFVFSPTYWRDADGGVAMTSGEHSVQVRFHFEALLWNAADRELWQGKVDSKPLTFTVRD